MNIIKFGSDTKHRKQWFTGISFSHPAKLMLPLQLWLIENFTKEGETILDPMAGSGTILVACSLGRHVVAVELEQKFVDMMKGNWQKIQERGCQMGYSMGKATILQGDARNLTGILVDKIITSPPYEQSLDRWAGDNRNKLMEDKGLHAMPKVDKIITSPPYAEAQIGDNRKVFNPTIQGIGRGDGKKRGGSLVAYHESTQGSNNNIANLPYGQMDSLCSPQVDKIISSPPYEASLQGEQTERDRQHDIRRGRNPDAPGACIKGYTDKVDAVISSPPYEGSVSVPDSKAGARAERLREAGYDPKDYQGGTGRNLQQDWSYHPQIDAVISSPPYEGSMSGGGNGIDLSKTKRDGDIRHQSLGLLTYGSEYSKEKDNIGNLKSDSYLSAMLQVYQQCHAVLKPGGLMILVIKNFLRNRKEVFLDADTIALCEKSGFSFVDRYYRRLTQQSFWRTIYAQRYPTAPRIEFEHILIFKKGDVP